MNADCAFAIGASHQICQDYARASQTANRVSVWLADGCSSSPDTDWGARLLVQAATLRQAEWGAGDARGFADSVAQSAANSAQLLGLPPESVDATLLGIVTDQATGQFRVVLYGDGVAVLGRRDGSRDIYHIEYARNYPLYLNYRTDSVRARRWASDAANERITTLIRTGKEAEVSARRTDESTLLEGQTEEFEYAAIFSDGVTSFTRRSGDATAVPQPIGYEDVLTELLAIKSWRGEFVRRRLGRFLRDADARQMRHHDDLTMALVYFGE